MNNFLLINRYCLKLIKWAKKWNLNFELLKKKLLSHLLSIPHGGKIKLPKNDRNILLTKFPYFAYSSATVHDMRGLVST